ncbi:MAG: DHHA2 domain-containing protein, partial [Clostridium sp.]
EIFYQDFKRFTAGKIAFGVGQITSLNSDELETLKDRMLPYMLKAKEDEKVDMMFFMLTNILTESTVLLCQGQGAEQLVIEAFHLNEENETRDVDEKDQMVSLPGVVSRKKQLVPGLMIAIEQ